MYLIMICCDEDTTDAEHTALYRMNIFSGNNSFPFEKNMRNYKEI